MNKKKFFLLLLVSALAFSPYLFLEGLFGYDSYAFLNSICNDIYLHNPAVVTTPFANFVFQFLPCNILALKLFLFLIVLSCVIILAKTGEIINKEYGWMAGAFMFAAPITIQVFSKLENDTLALPFIFLAIYFLVKAEYHIEVPKWIKTQPFEITKLKYRIFAITALIVAIGFWNAAVFVVIGMALMYWWVFALSLPGLAYYGKTLFQQVAIPKTIAENAEIMGFLGLFLLLLGFAAPILAPLTLFLGIISFLNGKFVILAIPLLSLSLLNLLLKIKVDKELWIKAVFILCFAIAAASGVLMVIKPIPLEADWNAVDYSLQLHTETGKEILSDFQLGYIYDYRDYESTNYGSLEPNWQYSVENRIVVTHHILDCTVEREFEPYYLYNC